jgi:predicted  nucleic acid-binding Zn-ribbon protein
MQSIGDFAIFLQNYQTLKSENTRLRAAALTSSTQAEIRALHEEIDLLRSEKDQLKQGIKDMGTENVKQRDMLEKENQQLKSQAENLEDEVKITMQKLKTFQQRIEALKDEF